MSRFTWMVFFVLFASKAFAGLDFMPLPKQPPIPADNPQSAAKIKLGKELFFDHRISKNGLVSCATCHNLQHSGENNLPFTIKPDGKPSRHTAPTIWNSAFMSTLFWGGGASTLEEQSEAPLEEMGLGDTEEVVKRVKAIPGYASQFKEIFEGDGAITLKTITQAIASYERTLITNGSPLDRFLTGDRRALSVGARRGMNLFKAVGCISCHNGPNFAGPLLPAGQGYFRKFPTFAGTDYEKKYKLAEDLGRFNMTQKPEDKNMWRVPTLRNIALTAPYFHNGSVPTLAEAVRVMAKTQLNADLSSGQVDDLVSFLKSLTGRLPDEELPELPD